MTSPPDALAARTAAIDVSGWGRRFVFYQPRNLAFWVYVLLVGHGLAICVLTLGGGFDATAVAVSIVLFTLYGVVFWWLTQRADRYTVLPDKLMVVAFLWGAFGATWSMAASANSAIGDLYAKTLGQSFALDWQSALSAPFTEELAKGAGLVLLIALAPRIVRTAFDGFILGLLIGLGFQVLEDIQYAVFASAGSFGADAVASALTVVWLRMAGGVAGHFVYTAVFCAGLVYLLGRPAEPRRIGRGLLLMAIAPVLHAAWNSAGTLARGNGWLIIGWWVVVIVVALVVFARVYGLTVTRERELVRVVMEPEVTGGVMTSAELDAMAGNRKDRRRYRRSAGGPAQRRRARYTLAAAYDLAAALTATRGADSDRVRFARAEIARIRRGEPSQW